MVLILIITAIALYTGYLFLVDIKKALLYFTALFILAYSYKFSVIGLNMSLNLLVILCIPTCIKYLDTSKRYDYKILHPFLFLQISRLLVMPFQQDVPISYQLAMWFKHSVFLLIIPYIIWRIGFYDVIWSGKLMKTIRISSVIALCYAILLIFLGGNNPYQSIMVEYTGGKEAAAAITRYFSAGDTGRMFGRISSTFNHPMLWCVFLVNLFYVFWVIYDKKSKNRKYLYLMLLVSVCVFTSGVRSGLFALFIGLFIFILTTNSRRVRTQMIGVSMLILGISSQIPYVQTYVGSMFASEEDTEIKGSSVEMRILQLGGCLDEISSCPIQGKGYGWVEYYKVETKNGDHPVILGFESLLYSVLCESGFLGVAIWIIFIVLLFRTNRLGFLTRDQIPKLDAMIVSFFVYVMVTGGGGQDLYAFCLLYSSIVTVLYHKNNNYNLIRI